MIDRVLVWLSAGVVTAGVSAAMLAGAGVAIATEGAAADGGETTTSDASDSTEAKADSVTPSDDTVESTNESPDSTGTDEDAGDEEAADEEAEDETPEDQTVVSDQETTTAKHDSRTVASDRDTTTLMTPKAADALDGASTGKTETDDTTLTAKKDAETDVAETSTASTATEASVLRKSVVVETVAAEDTPEVAAVAFASAAEAAADAAAAAPPLTALLNVIGTIVFNLYGLVTRVVGGPPVLPPNSTVSVRSSTLVLECGCNEGDQIEVPADWYIPEGADEAPPQRLIYLQHGFLAQGPWYSHTAAALAEETKSIVVAPSITSNFLAADACWLGAPPMHEAIGQLFNDGNTALADSALAAGYAGPIPDRVVLIGHSLGGGAVIGTAGAMADNDTPDNPSLDRLAGVIMLDGVPFDPNVAASLEDLDEIPIYQLAAPKYFWNQFGVGTDALLDARPNQFIGVTLVGGSHVDSMRGGNPLIQFSQQLVSGFSTPENVAAAQILMVGWANDMFAGDQEEGIYLDRGEELTIDTPAGEATLINLPNTLEKPFILNFLQEFGGVGNSFYIFEPSCVAESMGAARCTSDSVAA